MNPIYFTVTGTNYYYGNEYFKPEMKLQLIKEPDNKADKEAIRVELEGLGKVGYVANSPHSVIGNSYSAGRLYDKIGEAAEGKVLYVLPQGVLCTLLTGGGRRETRGRGKRRDRVAGISSLPRNAMRPKKLCFGRIFVPPLC